MFGIIVIHWSGRVIVMTTLPSPIALNIVNMIACSVAGVGLTSVTYAVMSGQNGRHFADVLFKCFLLNENAWISIKISLKFVPKGPNKNIPALAHIMVWCRPGDKPLPEPMIDYRRIYASLGLKELRRHLRFIICTYMYSNSIITTLGLLRYDLWQWWDI